MDNSRRLAMRSKHACRAYYCTCGKIVHGNGGKAMHSAMHKRNGDKHHFTIKEQHPEDNHAGE